MKNLLLLFIVQGLYITNLFGESSVISVVDQNIILPSPIGYYQVYGRNAAFDKVATAFIPTGQKLLSLYYDESGVADVIKGIIPKNGLRYFSVIYINSMPTNYTQSEFQNDLKGSIRSSETTSFPNTESSVNQLYQNNEDIIGAKLKTDNNVKLGVFNEDPNSISSTSIARYMKGGKIYVTVTSSTVISVKNRILILLACSDYSDKSDIQWTRQTSLDWKNAIMNSN